MSGGILEWGRFAIAYRAHGEGERTLVCVNGAQQTMASWRSVVRAFAGEIRVLTFDFPGQGKSGHIDGGIGLSFDEQVEILRRVVHTAAAAPCAILSGSWGSYVAAAYAARYPDEVKQLILASFGLRPTPALKALIARGQRLCREGRPTELGEMIVASFGARLPATMKRMVNAQFQVLPESQVASFVAHSQLVDAIGDARELIDLRAITADTLVINGGADELVDLDDIDLLDGLIPRCRTEVVPDTGHFLHLEQPAVLETYRQFLFMPAP